MGRIFFCGDTHGIFDHVREAVCKYQPSAVIFLGDLQLQRPLELELTNILDTTEIWWIHGNHDTDSDADYDNLFGSTLANRNLHGKVVEIAGVTIAGLGGIFRGEVWAPPGPAQFDSPDAYLANCSHGNLWRGCMPRKHHSSIFPKDYARLIGQRADILVTHEAPSSHPHGFDVIDDLARSMGVRVAFHGHHHDRLNYSDHHRRLNFAAYGVGFCSITDQAGYVIRPGKFDDLHRHRQSGPLGAEECDL